MKKTSKKRAFTIVELVIVMAVIAILIAVLIPTFSGIIKKANQSSDTQVVRNMNTAIQTDLAGRNYEKHTTMYDALEVTKEYGYDVKKIVAKSSMKIAWDAKNDRFVLLDEGKLGETQGKFIYPVDVSNNETGVITDEERINYFVVRDTRTEANGYSIYASDKWAEAEVTDLTVGFDPGDRREDFTIKKISYVTSADKTYTSTAVLRSNDFATEVEVNAPKDTVKHDGPSGHVHYIAVAGHSAEEYGMIGRIEIDFGRCVIKNGAIVHGPREAAGDDAYIIKEEGAIVYDQAGKKIDGTFNTSEAGSDKDMFVESEDEGSFSSQTCQHEDTNIIYDGNEAYEVCKQCGYTVVTIIDVNTGTSKKDVVDNDNKNKIVPMSKYNTGDAGVEVDEETGKVKLSDEAIENAEKPVVDKNKPFDAMCDHSFICVDGGEKCKYVCSKCSTTYYEEHVYVNGICSKCGHDVLANFPSDAVVYILETKEYYMSLQEGIDATLDKQTIVLLKDIEINNSASDFSIKQDHTDIDLNGHSITLHTTVNLAKKDNNKWVPVEVNMKKGTIINDDLVTGLRYETGSAGSYEQVTFKAVNRDWSGTGSAGGHYSQSSAIQVYANNQTGSYEKNTYSFTNCIFAETTLELGGGSGSCNNYDVMVEGCTFTLTDTSSASGINVNHYEYGSIAVNNSIFNINPVPGDGSAYGIYTQSDPSNTKNNYLHVYLSGNTFTCTNKAEPYEQRNSYYMSGSYSEATTFHDDGTNTYTMNNIPVSHYKTDSSNNLWKEGTSSGSWDYRWTSSARYAVLEACEDEYKLFRTTSGSGYKNGDMYLVQKDDGYFVASGTTINPIQYSWPTIDENDVVDYGGSYYDKSKVVYTTDLTSGLAGGNDDVKIYKLNGMTLLKFSDGKTTTDIGYVDSTEGYVYQCVYEDGKQYDTTVNGLTKNTHYTVDETGKITVNAGAFNQKRNATIYNKQKYTWTASGSATGSGTYYAGTATASFSVTTPQSASLYKVTSVQIGGVEADPSKYYIKNDPKYSLFYVCFDNAATDITGNVTFTIAPISENLVAEVSAFRDDTTNYNTKLSYLFVEGENVYIFNAGTSNMVFYTGSVTSPASTSAYTNTVTKTGDDVYFDYSSTSKYNYKLGEKLVDQNGVQIYELNNVLKLVYSNVYYFGEDFTITYGEKKEFTIPGFDANKHYELVGDNKSIATLDASTGKITIDTTLFSSSMISKNTFSLGYRECYTITAAGDVVGVGSKTTPSVTTTMNTAISNKNIYVTGDTNSYNITVTVGGVALASNQYTATWNNSSKCYRLTINAQYVTGDIVVTATAK